MGSANLDRPPPETDETYAIAREILGRLIGYAGDRIARENTMSTPDLATIESWQQRRHVWSERFNALHEVDAAAIQAVLDEDGPTLRSMPRV